MKLSRSTAALAAALLIPAVASCTDNTVASSASAGGSRSVEVTSTDEGCDLSSTTAPAGRLVYTIRNQGTQVTEFYLYGADGLRVVGEVENIGPGLSRDLVVNAAAGNYVAACKPGMKGRGIRSDFRVRPSEEAADLGSTSAEVDAANEHYASYVEDQAAQLLAGTRRFAAAYEHGDDARARALYPSVRTHWERIEPVAESFGDLDPRMDAREADLEPGQAWTGWHRIEKDLWPPAHGYTALTRARRVEVARRLVADTATLHERIGKLSFSVDQIGNGAKSLLDEVATGKVTGEEEVWSHTDLYDFAANVDGARVAFEGLAPVLDEKDPALSMQIEQRFAALEQLLHRYRTEHGFVSYDRLDTRQVKQLSDAVNALSEPLSRLTAAVTL